MRNVDAAVAHTLPLRWGDKLPRVPSGTRIFPRDFYFGQSVYRGGSRRASASIPDQ